MNKIHILTCSTHVLCALEVNINMSLCTRDNRCQGPFTFCRQFPVYISGAFALLRVRQMQGERTQVNNSNIYIYFFKGKFGLKLISKIYVLFCLWRMGHKSVNPGFFS